jgi:flavin reductase (DIM6/NTAB) family NADH-FMN oxidoreductase RutF
MGVHPHSIVTAPFKPFFFPVHLALLSVGENMMPIGFWTVISKEPFRILISLGVGNHSLALLRKYKEAALHFMPWQERDRVVRAGYLSGRDHNKAESLGFKLFPAEKLTHTRLVEGADSILEMKVHMEIANVSREFAPHIMNVVHVHEVTKQHQPILFNGLEDFSTAGERWNYAK